MIGADDEIGGRTTVIMGWAHPDRDPRQAGDWFNAPDDLRWSVNSLEPLEIWREIGGPHFRAIRVGHDRLDDRRVAHVLRLGFDEVRERDVAKSFLLIASQQPRKYGIGIKMRITPPHDASVLIHERRRAAVADQRQIEILLFGLTALGHALLPRAANSASHSRTASGSENALIAPGRGRPTE